MNGMGWADERGVSEVLGAMLLFGIMIAAIGGYQAFIVPQQNAEVELKHDAQVDDEFADIQASISNAAATGTSRTTSVTLGTHYPVRAAGLNPPTVSGQLSTGRDGAVSASGSADADLEEICGTTPETRAITYRADYNELEDTGTLVYENGVTYRQTNGNVLLRSDQELVDGSTIRLFPLTGDGFSTGSASSEQLRFVPGETGGRSVDTDGDPLELTFPSRIEAATWEDEILRGVDNVTGVSQSGDEVTVAFEPGTYTVQCTPVGTGSEPEQDEVPSVTTDPEEAADRINPVSSGKVVLNQTNPVTSGGEENVSLIFENKTDVASEVSIVGARLNYYFVGSSGGSGTKPASVTLGNTSLTVGGEFSSLSDPVELNPNSTTVQLDFDEGVMPDHLYVLTLEYSHGDVGTYFVSHPKN